MELVLRELRDGAARSIFKIMHLRHSGSIFTLPLKTQINGLYRDSVPLLISG